MAKNSRGNLHIYVLGLPRKALVDLFNLFDQERGQSEEDLFAIFGKPSYTFLIPEKIHEAAPLREFGPSFVSKNSRESVYRSLPISLQEYLISNYPKHQFGYFVDSNGRKYKQENEEEGKWTVMIPFILKKDDSLDFPKSGEKITLRHIHDVVEHEYFVREVGFFKKASAIIYLF